MTIAEVRLWGRRGGAVTSNHKDRIASFEYDPGFRGSGIEISPVAMPLGSRIYQFPGLPEEPFYAIGTEPPRGCRRLHLCIPLRRGCFGAPTRCAAGSGRLLPHYLWIAACSVGVETLAIADDGTRSRVAVAVLVYDHESRELGQKLIHTTTAGDL